MIGKPVDFAGAGSVLAAALLSPLLAGCGSADGGSPPRLPQATPAALKTCTDLGAKALPANTVITSAGIVAAGALTVPGATAAVPEHCLVKGTMNARVSPVDGKNYAIGFEMRLPRDWNGRFYHQGNGGVDGSVVTALGGLGGAPTTNALIMGFAVLSSDAGHGAPTPFFGLDPQARLDYGYQAVGTLTPMAKQMITNAYGKAPDRSYFGGCSNGGRHAMVAAARYSGDYDGILAGNPGFHLPKAATAQLWKAQLYASIAARGANGQPDLGTAVTPAEFKLLGSRINAKCDALDGASDGIVADTKACQAAFDVERDVPSCSGARDGSCLTPAQKSVLARIFEGARNSKGEATYSDFWWDPGVAGSNFAFWHFSAAQNLDPGAVAFIFTTPPADQAAFLAQGGLGYALAFSLDNDYPRIFATTPTYTQSSWSFMTPPHETDLSALRDRGGKMIVYHGVADGVFSPADTARWYDGLQGANDGHAGDFARLFLVPGMNHCSGGPSTDQFDLLTPLVQWVEQGRAPERVLAKARGPGANVVNPEVPASWSAGRTRPLCPYPQVARYNGSGDIESAESFSCR